MCLRSFGAALFGRARCALLRKACRTPKSGNFGIAVAARGLFRGKSLLSWARRVQKDGRGAFRHRPQDSRADPEGRVAVDRPAGGAGGAVAVALLAPAATAEE